MSKAKYSYIFLFLLFALSACSGQPTARQIAAEGEKYAMQSQADQDALNAKQARMEAANLEAYRQERRVYWGRAWDRVFGAVVIGGFFFAFSVFFSGAALVWNVQKAASHFVMVRASILPVQANGVRPALVYPEYKSLLHSLTYDKAIRITDTKYHLVDSQTGEHCLMNLNKEASTIGMELLRQAIMVYLPTRAQVKSSVFSGGGDIAEAIGHSDMSIPGPTIIDLEEVKRLISNE